MGILRSNTVLVLGVGACFLFGCDKSKNAAAQGAGGAGLLFYAANYGQGSAIYRLNLETFEVIPAISHARYTDAKLFWDAQTAETWVASRNAAESAPSSLTRLSSDGITVLGELGALPVNVYGVQRLGNDTFFVSGWNNGEIAVVPKSLSAASIPTRVPNGVLNVEDKRWVGALAKGTTVFVISGGVDANFAAQTAKIHKLDSSYSQVESTTTIADCKNIAGDGNEGVVFLAANRAVVACNPRYNSSRGTWAGSMALVLLEATESGATARMLLSGSSASDFDMYNIRAVSADASAVLIEEAASISVDPFTVAKSRYWFNVNSGEKVAVTSYGGMGLFVNALQSYVFSCVPQGDGTCKAQSFCLVPHSAQLGSMVCQEKSVRFDYVFRMFPVLVPEFP
jgi:hypothetical protein